jgi:hypothetical protein
VTVRLPSSVREFDLVTDVVVLANEHLRLESAAHVRLTLNVRGFRVEKGGTLELHRLMLVDSLAGSAVFAQGTVQLSSCTFSRCVTGTNFVARFGEGLVPRGDGGSEHPSRGAFLLAIGGAVFMYKGGARLKVIACTMEANAAKGSGVAAWGGAIGLFGGAARLEDSLFRANYAEGGVFTAMGGAAFAMYAYAEVERANFTANEARGATQGGTQFSFGGALALQSAEANITASGFVDNVCRAAHQTCSGGAIYIEYGLLPTVQWTFFWPNVKRPTASRQQCV